MLRRHQAAGPGTATWLPALFFPAGGCETWSPRQTLSRKSGGCDPRLSRPRPRSQPACRSRGPELRPPPARPAASSLLLARSLARSLPPPGGLGADSAARCSRGWKMAGNDCGALLDEELSSFFLNYLSDTQVLPAGNAGQGLGCRAAGLQPQLQRKECSGGRTGAIGGFRLQSPPFHVPCPALRYSRSKLQVAGACCSIGGYS